MPAISVVSNKFAAEIFINKEPKGLFYTLENGAYIGIDNSTGDAWVEEFKTEKDCLEWLVRKDDIKEDTYEEEIYKKALCKWGEQAQITMVFEEMAELQKELCKHLRGKKVAGHIAEEIADVEIMLGQMKLIFNIEKLVKTNKKCKLARLEERLGS